MKVKFNFELSDIDGNQIIDYLNKNYDGSIEFVRQEIATGHQDTPFYRLLFSREWYRGDIYYNNYLAIDHEGIYVYSDEPWEGNDDDDMENLLSEWLKTYTFEKINYKEKFDKLMLEVYEDIMDRIDKKTSPEQIDAIIEKLKISKTYL
jgi:glutathione peroxidase-family protein